MDTVCWYRSGWEPELRVLLKVSLFRAVCSLPCPRNTMICGNVRPEDSDGEGPSHHSIVHVHTRRTIQQVDTRRLSPVCLVSEAHSTLISVLLTVRTKLLVVVRRFQRSCFAGADPGILVVRQHPKNSSIGRCSIEAHPCFPGLVSFGPWARTTTKESN